MVQLYLPAAGPPAGMPLQAPARWAVSSGGALLLRRALGVLLPGIYAEPVIGLVRAAALHAAPVTAATR